MDITRNQYFLVGLVLLYLGIELRMVDSVTLTPEFTKILASSSGHPLASMASSSLLETSDVPTFTKTINFPDWSGWGLVCFGSVLILHSFAMKKPGG